MTNYRVCLLFLACIPILSGALITHGPSSDQGAPGFRITGIATGFPDSTLLYLDDITDGTFRHLDSTYIIDEQFVLNGKLKTSPLQVSIRTVDYSDRCYFWLENTRVVFESRKGEFGKAVIRGSKTHDEQQRLNRVLDAATDRQQQELAYIKDHPQSILSACMLKVYSSSWDPDTVRDLYESFSQKNKNTFYGRAIAEYLSLNKNIQVGDPYVDFVQSDPSGKERRLSEFAGKVVLLEFWGSWCGPCRKQNPELVKIYERYRKKGFEIMGVAAETNKEFWLDAIAADGLSWTNVSDLRGDRNKAALIYGVSRYPSNFLIDTTGTVIARDIWGEPLLATLERLLP